MTPPAPAPASGRQRRRRSWISRLTLLAVLTVVAVLAAELVVRVLRLTQPFDPPQDTALYLFHESPDGPIRLTPGWEGTIGGAPVRISRDGFRDRPFTSRPNRGTERIAILGDSYTMGEGVPDDATYPKRLEALLGGPPAYEVLNAGVNATNTLHHRATLHDVLRDFAPTTVVLGFNVNDMHFETETRFERMQRKGQAYTVDADGRVNRDTRPAGLVGKLRAGLREHLHLYRYLSSLRSARDAPVRYGPAVIRAAVTSGGADRVDALIREMAATCAAAGVRFLVVLIPDLLDTPADVTAFDAYPFRDEHARLQSSLASAGIPCHDLLDAFGDRDPNDFVVHPANRHYDAAGNAILAETVHAVLRDALSPPRAPEASEAPQATTAPDSRGGR